MNQKLAIKKLYEILGNHTGYRIHGDAPSEKVRAKAKADQSRLIAERKAATEAMEKRAKFLLENDTEYVILRSQAERTKAAVREVFDILMRHKIEVGICNGPAFHVRAQAYTWEQIFEILEAQAKRRA